MPNEKIRFGDGPEENFERGPVSERVIRDFIESRHSVSNSGHNGIILKFLEEELPPEIKDAIPFDRDENPEGSLSVKALKIYNRGDASREFGALKTARGIVAENNDPAAPLAKVPKAHASYDLEISQEFMDYLNKNGASLVGRKVGILLMDYIEGADLATILYREALKRTHEEADPYAPEEIDRMPFDQLHHAVIQKLAFTVPGGKSRDEGEHIYKEQKLRNENAERLFRTLEDKGFVLPPAVLEQVQRTIDAFHENNFYHNDLHERQVILKDGDLTDPRAFIIDYGTSSKGKPGIDIDRKIMDDEDILRRLRRLTKTPEQKQDEKSTSEALEWSERIGMISRSPRLKEQHDSIEKAIVMDDHDTLEKRFIQAAAIDIDLDNFLAALINISRENPGHRHSVTDFLSSLEHDKKRRPFTLKRIKQAKEVIEKAVE